MLIYTEYGRLDIKEDKNTIKYNITIIYTTSLNISIIYHNKYALNKTLLQHIIKFLLSEL